MPGFRPRFFIDQETAAPPAEVTLGPTDSHHAVHVLRLQVGDACEVVVGAAVYAASVSRAEAPLKVQLTGRLQGPEAGAAYRSQVGLVQVISRPALFDQVLEKGTEVGAGFFVLVPAGAKRLSEQARASRSARWSRIVLEAAKQSKQVAVPEVEVMESVERALSRLRDRGVFSLVLDPGANDGLPEMLERRSDPALPLALWVGPEGGWSSTDREQFAAGGLGAARLGRGVLRAETAGPVAVAIARFVMRDW